MTKPSIRHSGPADEQAIKRLQHDHIKDLDFEASFPEDAYWLVADYGKGPFAACGYIDRPEERQIMLLWNPGAREYFAAHTLMEYVVAEAGNKTLWFVGANSKITPGVESTFGKWDFYKKGGNDQISVYVRDPK